MSDREKPMQVDNVVVIPRSLARTETIVAAVRAETQKQERAISVQLQELLQITNARHRARAEELVPIGERLTRPDLDDLIEIGRQMLMVRSRL